MTNYKTGERFKSWDSHILHYLKNKKSNQIFLTISPGLFLEMALKHITGGVVSHTHPTLVFRGSGSHNVVATHTLNKKDLCKWKFFFNSFRKYICSISMMKSLPDIFHAHRYHWSDHYMESRPSLHQTMHRKSYSHLLGSIACTVLSLQN